MLFRNVLSKRLGTQKFDCDERIPKRLNQTFPQRKQNVSTTFFKCRTFYENVLETKSLIVKKEFLKVKIKRFRNVNKTVTQRFHNVFFVSLAFSFSCSIFRMHFRISLEGGTIHLTSPDHFYSLIPGTQNLELNVLSFALYIEAKRSKVRGPHFKFSSEKTPLLT